MIGEDGDQFVDRHELHLHASGAQLQGVWTRSRTWISQDGRPFRCNNRIRYAVREQHLLLGQALAHAPPRHLDARTRRQVAEVVEDAEAEQRRVEAWEISATGPIFGAKMRWPEGPALAREQRLLADADPRFRRLLGVVVAGEVILYASLVVAGMPFLLLVGAAPNAIAFESHQFRTREFFITGLVPSAVLIGVIGLFAWKVWPWMGMPTGH